MGLVCCTDVHFTSSCVSSKRRHLDVHHWSDGVVWLKRLWWLERVVRSEHTLFKTLPNSVHLCSIYVHIQQHGKIHYEIYDMLEMWLMLCLWGKIFWGRWGCNNTKPLLWLGLGNDDTWLWFGKNKDINSCLSIFFILFNQNMQHNKSQVWLNNKKYLAVAQACRWATQWYICYPLCCPASAVRGGG